MVIRKYRHRRGITYCLFVGMTFLLGSCSDLGKKTIRLSIGTQDQVVNTSTGGSIIREYEGKLLEKYLPKTGKYKDVNYDIQWSSYTSGPPITNKMLADQIDIGLMGDFPAAINMTTFQDKGQGVETKYIATLAYSPSGAGNAVVIPKDSPVTSLVDLKGKSVSVPFGSAAHGMLIKALKDEGINPEKDVKLISQAPEVGGTSLRTNQIDAHADFVPFGELFPYRGFARKIFDGAQTNVPTLHGIVVRSDFAKEYPEVIVAYLKALLDANNIFREKPGEMSAKTEEWSGIEKEVVYMFLGPSGLQMIDPTIRPIHIKALENSIATLKTLGKLDADVNPADVSQWVDENYLRQAMKEMGLEYNDVVAVGETYVINSKDSLTQEPIKNPKMAAQLWVEGEDKVMSFASTENMMTMRDKLVSGGKKISAIFVHDREKGWKLLAENAFYVKDDNTTSAFLSQEDAKKFANETDGELASFEEIQQLLANKTYGKKLVVSYQ